MKLLPSLCSILWLTACSTPLMAEANERPGQVAALKELNPYLQLVKDGAAITFDDGMDALSAPNPAAEAKMRALLSKEGTFRPWMEKKSRAAFMAEHTIGWRGEQRMVEVSLSLSSNEALVDVSKDGKKLRYEIGEDAKWEMVQLFADQKIAVRAELEAIKEARAKSDAVEKTDAWRKPIAEGAALTVHEGLPHPAETSFRSESTRSDVVVSAGHAFYTPGVAAKHRADLAKLLADPSSYHRFSGAKECGGFHPDFAVSWRAGQKIITLQICYGCYETIFTDGKTSLRYDLNHEAGKKIEPLLQENGSKRPARAR
jgi:hypothetical protein